MLSNALAAVRSSVIHAFGSQHSKVALAVKGAVKDPGAFTDVARRALTGVRNTPLGRGFDAGVLDVTIQRFARAPSTARAQEVFTQLYAVRGFIRVYGDQVSDPGSAGSSNWYDSRACVDADKDIKAVKYFMAPPSQRGAKAKPMPPALVPLRLDDKQGVREAGGARAGAVPCMGPPRSPPPRYATQDPFPLAPAATASVLMSQSGARQQQSGGV